MPRKLAMRPWLRAARGITFLKRGYELRECKCRLFQIGDRRNHCVLDFKPSANGPTIGIAFGGHTQGKWNWLGSHRFSFSTCSAATGRSDNRTAMSPPSL